MEKLLQIITICQLSYRAIHTIQNTFGQVLDGNWYYDYQNNWNLSKLVYLKSEIIELTPNITKIPSAFDVALPGVLGQRCIAYFMVQIFHAKSLNH